jgi:predicted kinase
MPKTPIASSNHRAVILAAAITKDGPSQTAEGGRLRLPVRAGERSKGAAGHSRPRGRRSSSRDICMDGARHLGQCDDDRVTRPEPFHKPGDRPSLVVLVSGLPGVGKTTLITDLAPRLSAVVISRDQARLTARSLPRFMDRVAFRLFHRRLRRTQARAGRVLLAQLHHHLGRGDSVIVEAVAETELRQRLRAMCAKHDAQFVQVECVCDPLEHRRRLDGRSKFWLDVVERIAADYQPPAECLTIESSGRPADAGHAVAARLRSTTRTVHH